MMWNTKKFKAGSPLSPHQPLPGNSFLMVSVLKHVMPRIEHNVSWSKPQGAQPCLSNHDQPRPLGSREAPEQWQPSPSFNPAQESLLIASHKLLPSPEGIIPGCLPHVDKTAPLGRRRWLWFHRSPPHHSILSLPCSALGYFPPPGSSC